MPNFTKNQNLHTDYLKLQLNIACLLYTRAAKNSNDERADELSAEILELHNIIKAKK